MQSRGLFASLLLLIAVSSTTRAVDVPVFVWGKASVTYVPALTKYSTTEFAALVESQVNEETFTIVFAEEKLSTEDFSQCKLKTQTCFRNLAKLERKSYLPNVEEPLNVFEIESANIKTVHLFEDGSLSEKIIPKGGDIVIVNLNGDDFASHDALVDSLYNQLRDEHSNILAIYTGKTPSFKYPALIRRTRQAKQDTTPKHFKINNEFIIAYENFSVGTPESLSEVSLTEVKKNDVNSTEDTMQVDFTGTGAVLSLNFLLTQGSWELTGVTYDKTPYYLRHRVHVNQYFSFRCNRLEYYTADMKKVIVFEQVQLQPNWPSEDRPFTQFGDSWDCVGFTSPAILTGLFLVVIFIFIGGFGITWMMDMRTMDRFDDPKGKTITVSVTE